MKVTSESIERINQIAIGYGLSTVEQVLADLEPLEVKGEDVPKYILKCEERVDAMTVKFFFGDKAEQMTAIQIMVRYCARAIQFIKM